MSQVADAKAKTIANEKKPVFTEFKYTDKMKKAFEIIYFIYFSLVLVNAIVSTSQINIAKYSRTINNILLFVGIFIVAKIALEWKDYWNYKDIILAIITTGFLIASNLYINKLGTMEFCLLILGAKNIDYKKILKLFTILVLVSTIVIVSLALLKKIPNMVTYRNADTDRKRYAMGFAYCTWFGAYLLAISAAWAYYRESKISWVEIGVIFVFAILGYVLSEARIAAFSTLIVGCAATVNKIFNKKNKEIRLLRNKIVTFLLVYVSLFAFAFAVVLALIYKFDNSFFIKLNSLLSSRPYYNALALKRYHITALGQIVRESAVFSDGMEGIDSNYFLVNCSYMRILLWWGVLGLIAILTNWIIICKREVKRNNYFRVIVLAALSFYFFFEQRMFEISINPFLLLLFAHVANEKIDNIDNTNNTKDNKYKMMLTLVIAAVAIEALIFNYKSVATLMDKRIDFGECSVLKNDFEYDEESDLFEYPEETTLRVAAFYGKDYLRSVCTNFVVCTKDDKLEYSHVMNAEYTTDVYITEDAQLVHYGTYKMNTGDPASMYVEIDKKDVNLFVQYVFHFPENCRVTPIEISMNGPKPFGMNYIRVLVIAIIFNALYLGFGYMKSSIKNRKEN